MENTTISLLIVCTTPPLQNPLQNETMHFARIIASYSISVSILFMGDGVFQLLNTQTPFSSHEKSIAKQLMGLYFYEIDKLYLDTSSLENRAFTQNDLIPNVHCLSNSEIKKLWQIHDYIVHF